MTRAKRPTPEQIDELAVAYLEAVLVISAGKMSQDTKKQNFIKLLKKYGIVPEGAEKSMRLEGNVYVVTASFGTSSSVREKIVEKIKEQLTYEHRGPLFDELFVEKTSYVVAPAARARLAKLGKSPADKKLRRLFAQVMDTKPKEPSLKVESKDGKKKGNKR